MIVVAFGHRSRVGKDTAAKFLLNTLRQTLPNKHVNQSAFATQLKIVTQHLFRSYGVQSQSFYELNALERRIAIPELGKSPMDLWIEIGMFVRSIHPDAWVRLLLDIHKKDDVLIISDLRFLNEIECIRKQATFSLICKINRSDAPVYDSPADNALQDYDGWDCTINNNGTMGQFYSGMTEIAKLVGSKV